MSTLQTSWDNMIPYRTESEHCCVLMNSVTELKYKQYTSVSIYLPKRECGHLIISGCATYVHLCIYMYIHMQIPWMGSSFACGHVVVGGCACDV